MNKQRVLTVLVNSSSSISEVILQQKIPYSPALSLRFHHGSFNPKISSANRLEEEALGADTPSPQPVASRNTTSCWG